MSIFSFLEDDALHGPTGLSNTEPPELDMRRHEVERLRAELERRQCEIERLKRELFRVRAEFQVQDWR